MTADELSLIERARTGSRPAFDQLDIRYRAKLGSFCGRFFLQEEDREEAVQRTLLRAWRSLGGFDGRATFATWLYKIATNTCLDLLQERKRIPRESLDDPANVAFASQPDPQPAPEQLAVWRQMRSAIFVKGKAVKPPWDDSDTAIYFFHCEREESFRQISGRIGMEESAVKQRYYRKIEPVLRAVAQEFGEE